MKTFINYYRDVQMSARARLVMKPTTKQVPFVGGLQFCFLTIPQIGFDLDGIADIIDWAPLKRKVCIFGAIFHVLMTHIVFIMITQKRAPSNFAFQAC